MATNANLPPGAFLTTIGGKKCTAVPLKKNAVTSTTTAQTTSVSSITTTTTASSQATTTVDVTTSLVTSTTATVVAPPPPPETTTVLESTTTAMTTTETTTSAAITTTAVASTTSTSTAAATTSIATTQTQVSPPEGQVPPGTTRTTTAATTSTSLDTVVSTATSETQTPPAQTTTTPPVAVIPALPQGTTTSTISTSSATQPDNTQDPDQAPESSTDTLTTGTTTTADGGATTTAVAPELGSTTSTTDPASQTTTALSTNSDGALVPLPVTNSPSADLSTSPAPESIVSPGATNLITTTNDSGVVVTQTPTINTRPQETALASTAGSSGMSPQATAAVAGGVAGSVVIMALLAFLFFWRRRRRRNNGSVPTTPTSLERPSREKEPYVIMRSSIGPTPATEKFKATVHYRYKQAVMQVAELGVRAAETVGLRKRSDVDLDRGLSQYGPLMAGGHSRSNSGVLLPPTDQPPKREYPDWWDRLTEDGENWHIKSEDSAAPSRTGSIPIGIQGLPSAATMTATVPAAANNNPTGDKTRMTTQGKSPLARGGQPREGAPSDHFLSNLGLNIDSSDPFSDVNSMSHVSAMVMPLAAPTEQNQNPFSDANAVSQPGTSRGPGNYVQGVQHARQESYGATLKGKQTESVYRDRESTYSQESFQTRRNRVKSDPFDLDRLVGPLNNPLPASTAGFASNGRPPITASATRQPEPPRRAHVRQQSATSSKYSSGVQSEWSDPGPDVGPSIGRMGSKGSMGSIGKAK